MHGALSKLAPSIVVSFPMSDYFPRRSACDEETRAFSIDRTASAAPANYGAAYRGPSQGLAAMRDVVSPKRRFGSPPEVAVQALMSAFAGCGHNRRNAWGRPGGLQRRPSGDFDRPQKDPTVSRAVWRRLPPRRGQSLRSCGRCFGYRRSSGRLVLCLVHYREPIKRNRRTD